MGHRTENCPKDPNLRSNFDAEEEITRIKERKVDKKRVSQSVEVNNRLIERLSKMK